MKILNIVVKNSTADYAFSGDATKTWFCEVIESNLNQDGNPIVNSVRPGFINLTCNPRQLNAKLKIALHTEAEKEEVAKLTYGQKVAATAKKITPVTFSIFKWVVTSCAILILGSLLLAFANKYYDLSGFKSIWNQTNVIGLSETIEQSIDESTVLNNHPLFESEAIKELESRYEMKYSDLFWNVGDGYFMMKNLVLDKNSNPALVTYSKAESYCEQRGGFVPTLDKQKETLPNKNYVLIKRWADFAEWTSDPMGWDNYVINIKDGIAPGRTYAQDGQLIGDDGDVLTSFRCAMLSQNFGIK